LKINLSIHLVFEIADCGGTTIGVTIREMPNIEEEEGGNVTESVLSNRTR
jgi:hypothetical protein